MIIERVNSESKKLVCSCNDNSQCTKKSGNHNDVKRNKMGRCSVESGGKCYAARVIDRGLLGNFIRLKMLDGTNSFKDSSLSVETKPDISKNFIRIIYGCIDSYEKVVLACSSYLTKHAIPQSIECCDSGNMCNAALFPKFHHYSEDIEAVESALKHIKKSGFWREGSFVRENTGFKPNLNLGPDMLIARTSIRSMHNRNLIKSEMSKEHLTFDSETAYIFNTVPVVTYSLVFFILSIILALVGYIYKRRMQKDGCCLYEFSKCSYVTKRPAVETICTANIKEKQPCSENLHLINATVNKHKLNVCHYGPSLYAKSSNQTHDADCSATNKTYSCPYLFTQSGLNTIASQTINRQITLTKFLGDGRISDVWDGIFKGEEVIAKVFHSGARLANNVWRRTISLHRSILLRHKSIHGLMFADWLNYPTEKYLSTLKNNCSYTTSIVPSPCALLIGEKCSYGTLKDLLSNNIPDVVSCKHPTAFENCDMIGYINDHFNTACNSEVTRLRMLMEIANSLARGLWFLHSEFSGTRGKPSIAHRNLKPSNIYIRSDWSCCIGDIGYAVRSPPPCPLPIPTDHLYSVYEQYENYLIKHTDVRGNSCGFTASEKLSDDPIHNKRSAYITLQEYLTGTEYNECFRENRRSLDQYSLPAEDETCNSLFDKLEVLDWWPIGGLHAGTPRYLAPELLCKSINPFCLESYQKSDIYALALILWEIVSWALPKSIWPGVESSDASSSLNKSSFRRTQCSAEDDSMSLNHFHSSHGSKSSNGFPSSTVYSPVYQDEWFQLLSRLEYSCTTDESHRLLNSRASTDGQMKNKEPDIHTMIQLVCEQHLRPRTPTPLPVETINGMIGVCSSSHPKILPFCDTVMAVHMQLRNTNGNLNNNNDNFITVDNEKLIAKIYRGSSSSSASSLQSNDHTNLNLNSKLHNSDELEIIKLQSVIANQFAFLLPECWTTEPDSRLSALRIRKRLQSIYELMSKL
uniref:receptor protein serine/threonine kinase n=1 Tax=Trichobilharzia regenti TaxID=157069 RepID=A0AA85K4Y5_TRIRE|nr:unnamed protein product [Trichobilharzia regenti]